MDTELKGRGVLVTGGAGGIGTALVRAFSEEGARVAVHYRSSEDKALRLSRDVGGVALRADLTVEAEVDALVPAAVAALGRLDVLVCNAGRYPAPDESLWDMSLARWRQTLAENLDSVFLCCRAFLRHMATTGTGNIVIISSTAGLFGEAGHTDYAAAKGALASGFVKSLKNELGRVAPLGRVNVVCPGWTEVDRNRAKVADAEFVKRVTRTMPLRKVGQPEDVARVVVTLASDRISGHVTGEVVTVAGGMEGRVLHDV
ncbi:SDR family oxidoreductase [Myxococcus sp. K15C18031901]|uniref:SDR family NAD(P)-dependent oxidoreductase n=1 Tax=Myxococcus dinghuensis TaxID=2906761 RepID=UPI0020A7BE2F|nr:SDR family NAD(P)-dependent oxidoreductase [Myxococcus dinghuensis]MCP3103498.1 SDR family oxidoreductase [Myxococcus dinghuensis]